MLPSLTATLLPELSDGTVPLADSYVLAGFERATWTQMRLFAALKDGGRLAGRLGAVGGNFRATARSIEAPSQHDERHWVARWARERLEAQPDASVGVIVPDLARHAADFRRSFLDTFDPLWRDRDGMEFPVSIDDGSTLANAGFVHTALLLLRVPAGQLDYREIGQLLRSPYLRGGVSEADARARLDLSIRDGRTQGVDLRSLCRRDSADLPREFLDAIGRMLEIAEQAGGRRAPAAWVPLIESLLKAAGLGEGRAAGQDEERVRDAWTGLIEQFATLGEVVGDIPFNMTRRLLSNAAKERRLRSTTRADGVQIMSPWEADGHAFDAVWVCGMTSAAWPPPARPSPLIALGLQRERDIPDAIPERFREQALASIGRLLGCATNSIASWAARAGEEEQVASPSVAALPSIEPAALALTDDRADLWRAILAGPRTSEQSDPAPRLAADEQVRGGAKLLDLQSACPARAFFEFRLGAKDLRSPPYALDARARGNLLHDAAQCLYHSLREAGGPARVSDTDLAEFVGASVEFALERNIPKRHPLVDTLRTNECRRLTRLLGMLVTRDRERGEFNIVELENEHIIGVGGIELKVRFDRVDASPSGAKLVIDYKTGAHFSIGKCRGERPLQLQLPLYAAYASMDGIALYWLHADGVRIDAIASDDFGGLIAGRARKNLLDTDTWAALISEWRTTLEGLLAEFAAGDCRIDLEEDRWARGQFAMLSRRWDIDRDTDPADTQ